MNEMSEEEFAKLWKDTKEAIGDSFPVSRSEFIEILSGIEPNLGDYYPSIVSLPKAAEMVAIHAFMSKIENEDTDILRRHLEALHTLGTFKFRE